MKMLNSLFFSCLCFTALSQESLPVKNFYTLQKMNNDFYNQKGKTAGGYKQWKRMEWYFETRTGKNGEFLNIDSLKQSAINKINNNIQLLNSSSGEWTMVGPFDVGNDPKEGIGRVNRLAFHPTDANILFAASAGGGVWKTINGGLSWTSLTNGLPNLNLSGVAVDATNPATIFIATGDADGNSGGAQGCCGFTKYSTGVLKSTDGGSTWQKTGLVWKETDGIRLYKLIIHPTNGNILYAATNNGLFRSGNGGTTWNTVTVNTSTSFFYDIEFKPGFPSVVYASSGFDFFVSADNGFVFNKTFDLPPIPPSSYSTGNRTSIAVTPNNPNRIYLLAAPTVTLSGATPSTFRGLFISDNSGNSFTLQSNSPSVFLNIPSGGNDQSGYDIAIAANPGNQSTIVTGGVRLHVSSNSGSDLNFIMNDPPVNYHVDIHDLQYNPLNGKLYMGSDGGIYESIDNGMNWTPRNNNLQITQYYKISKSNAQPDLVVAGAQDNGSHKRVLNTTLFNQVTGQDGMDNAIDNFDSDIFYTSAQSGTFFRTNNGGNSFTTIDNTPGPWVTPIEVDQETPGTIYTGKGTGRYSLNYGNTWLSFAGSGCINCSGLNIGEMFIKATAPNNYLFAGSNNWNQNGYSTILAVANKYLPGAGWDPYILSSTKKISGLSYNPVNDNNIYVTWAGYFADDKIVKYNINQSPALGIDLTGSLPNTAVNCIVYASDINDPNDPIYIGTDIGVFYRDNTLGDWIPFSNGLPVVEVTDIEYISSVNKIRVSTYGRGIWESPVYGFCQATYSFTSHPASIPGFFRAANTVTSSAVIKGFGSNIGYRAGQRIFLTPGFTASASEGAKFNADINTCNTGGVPPLYLSSTFNKLSGYLIQ